MSDPKPTRAVFDRACDILDENSRLDDEVRYVFAAGVAAERARITKTVLAAFDHFVDTDDFDALALAMGKLRRAA